MIVQLKKGSGIHIKKKNRGSFTKWCGGNVTSECIQRGKHSSNPKIRKKATFAANARKWKHQLGGIMQQPIINQSNIVSNFSQFQQNSDYLNNLQEIRRQRELEKLKNEHNIFDSIFSKLGSIASNALNKNGTPVNTPPYHENNIQ